MIHYELLNKQFDIIMKIWLPLKLKWWGACQRTGFTQKAADPPTGHKWPLTTMPQIANNKSITSQTGLPEIKRFVFC